MTSNQKINKALAFVPYSASTTCFFKFIADSANSKQKLFDQIRHCRIDECKCRFNVWRLLMGVLGINSTLEQKIQQLNNQRNLFKDRKTEAYSGSGVADVKKQNPKPKNPLMKAMVKTPNVVENDDEFLKDQIRKDVERTYQQIQFFQQDCILRILSVVLFVWCKRNPQVSYKQGMNEVLASIVYVYFQQAYTTSRKPDGFDVLTEENKKTYILFNDIQNAESDIYGVFEKIMNIQNQMYKTQTDSNLKGVINPNSKNNTPILQRIINIIDQKLKALDIQLFRAIKLQDVQTKTFLLRWIRCMHTREFSLENSFLIWDSIFLDYCEWPCSKQKSQFEFIDAMCVAMFIYMRSLALTRESAYQILQIYQKYPNLKKGGYLQQLISLAWSLSQALRQPTNSNSSDWIGQQNTKRDNKLQFLKSRQSPIKTSKEQEQKKEKPKQIKQTKQTKVVKQVKPIQSQAVKFGQYFQKKDVKQIKQPAKQVEVKQKQPVLVQQKHPVPQDENFSTEVEEQVSQKKQIMPEFDFSITLDSFEWQTLVELLQKSLALNNDEQSRKYIIQGLQILKLKVENTPH